MLDIDAADLQQYNVVYLIVGIALVVLVAVWLGFVLWLTSAKRARKHAAKAPAMPQQQRNQFLDSVEQSLASFQRGELDLRQLHLTLAATVRDFVSERVGHDVHSWTAREIGRWDPTRKAGHLLQVWEEPSFARQSDADAYQSVEGARLVITQW